MVVITTEDPTIIWYVRDMMELMGLGRRMVAILVIKFTKSVVLPR
jgi:hypothetical protein